MKMNNQFLTAENKYPADNLIPIKFQVFDNRQKTFSDKIKKRFIDGLIPYLSTELTIFLIDRQELDNSYLIAGPPALLHCFSPEPSVFIAGEVLDPDVIFGDCSFRNYPDGSPLEGIMYQKVSQYAWDKIANILVVEITEVGVNEAIEPHATEPNTLGWFSFHDWELQLRHDSEAEQIAEEYRAIQNDPNFVQDDQVRDKTMGIELSYTLLDAGDNEVVLTGSKEDIKNLLWDKLIVNPKFGGYKLARVTKYEPNTPSISKEQVSMALHSFANSGVVERNTVRSMIELILKQSSKD